MNSIKHLVTISIFFVVAFFKKRSDIYSVAEYYLSNSRYKKIKKEQTFWECLTFSKFKRFVPQNWLIDYYLIVVIFAFSIVATVLLDFFGASKTYFPIPMFVFLTWTLISFVAFDSNADFTKDKENARKFRIQRNNNLIFGIVLLSVIIICIIKTILAL